MVLDNCLETQITNRTEEERRASKTRQEIEESSETEEGKQKNKILSEERLWM
jgi:hypothetical protein